MAGFKTARAKIAVIVGSNRRESLNRKLAQALVKLAGDKLAFSFVQITDLPLYNQDSEGELPKSVVRFKSEIAAADGLLFVTPEHNRSIPTVLKNAIDWGARPYGQNSWNAKPAAITGTSPGALGTALAQQHLRQVLGVLGALVMGGEAYISFKPGLIDAHDTVTDQATLGFLQAFIDQFGSLLDRLSLHASARLSEATA
jgi:chromate reductase